MDCFYAAIEIRDNPLLADKPIAVGGSPDQRGVICTCNYIARQYGVRSAMATAVAYRLCPQLHVLPVNMFKYKQVAKRIHSVFREFTDLVEPNRIRKSLSVERTFAQDVNNIDVCLDVIKELYKRLITRIQESAPDYPIKNQFIKIKFGDFKLTTAEAISQTVNLEKCLDLFRESYTLQKRPIRLLGLGVHFGAEVQNKSFLQRSLF